jgi:soluble lytic murein transglycosylase-like protein
MLLVRNDQVALPVIGAATQSNQIVYLSVGGFKTALKSMWATLVAPKKALRGNLGRQNRRTAGYVKPFYTAVPESAMFKMVLLAKEADLSQAATWRSLDGWDGVCFLIALDPEGVQYDRYDYRERSALQQKHIPALQTKLVGVLDQYHPFPVQPGWSAYLWDEATRAYPRLITEIRSYGECVAAYQVNLESDDWLEFIQQGLKYGDIAIHPQGG